MATRLARDFPEDARRRITVAVREAEAGTSGEIVVVLAEESDPYEEAAWRAAALAGGGVLVLDLLYRHAASFWLPLPADTGLLAALAGAVQAFFVVPRIHSLRRRLVSRRWRTARVRAAAGTAFHARRVAATRDRTGVLLYLSLFEREVPSSSPHGPPSPCSARGLPCCGPAGRGIGRRLTGRVAIFKGPDHHCRANAAAVSSHSLVKETARQKLRTASSSDS